MNRRIYLLALGTFTAGTEGYIVAGVLPDVARDVDVSVAACGQLITIFALAYALGGPVVIYALSHLPPKRQLGIAMLVFAAANALAAIAPNFAVLIAARVAAALGAALLMAPAAATAAAMSKAEHLPHALALTASGNAAALAGGAPLGTIVGTAFGWRWSFVLVAALSVVTMVLMLLLLPRVSAQPQAAVKNRFQLLRDRSVWWALATTVGVFLAAYTAYTYIAPIADRAAGLHGNGIALLMMTFGAGGLVMGRVVGRVLAHRKLTNVLAASVCAMTALLTAAAILAAVDQHSAWSTTLLFIIVPLLGAAWWGSGISQQTRMARLAPDHRPQALGLHYSAQYVGIALGGALGGLALDLSGPAAVAVVGAVVAALSLTSARNMHHVQHSSIDPPLAA